MKETTNTGLMWCILVMIYLLTPRSVCSISLINPLSCKSLEDASKKGICARGTDCYKSVSQLVSGPCMTLINDGECSKKCSTSLIRYFKDKSELRTYLDNCDCGNDFNCITHRLRFSRCFNSTTIEKRKSCSHQKARCLKPNNKSCYDLWVASFNACQGLFYGYKCTEECKASRNKLYSHKIGRKLKTCTCDGSFEKEKFCLEVRQNEKKLKCK